MIKKKCQVCGLPGYAVCPPCEIRGQIKSIMAEDIARCYKGHYPGNPGTGKIVTPAGAGGGARYSSIIYDDIRCGNDSMSGSISSSETDIA